MQYQDKRSEAGGNIVMLLCFTALGTRSMLTVREPHRSHYMELEASLWESLSVMNQICKPMNLRSVLSGGYSVCSVCNYKHKIYLYFYLDGAWGKDVLQNP